MKPGWTYLGLLLALLIVFCGCQSMYYGAMEKIGVHKREIMVDRVKQARDAQKDAKQQFIKALEQFRSVVAYGGGDLQSMYDKLRSTLDKSEDRAAKVHERIQAVEDVSEALFKEWRSELKLYSSASLRRDSEQKMVQTRGKYEKLIGAMKKAESGLEPVLVPMRDQVLYLKHNLNAKAIGSLSDELHNVQTNVTSLIRDMENAIAEADRFIATLRE